MTGTRVLQAALLTLLVASAGVAGETYHDTKYGCSVTLPACWRKVRTEAVRALMGMGSGGVNSIAAFVGTPDGTIGQPCVVVQIIEVPVRNGALESLRGQTDERPLEDLPWKKRNSLVEISRRVGAGGNRSVCFDPHRCRLVTYNERPFPLVGRLMGECVAPIQRLPGYGTTSLTEPPGVTQSVLDEACSQKGRERKSSAAPVEEDRREPC